MKTNTGRESVNKPIIFMQNNSIKKEKLDTQRA